MEGKLSKGREDRGALQIRKNREMPPARWGRMLLRKWEGGTWRCHVPPGRMHLCFCDVTPKNAEPSLITGKASDHPNEGSAYKRYDL